MTAKRPSTDGVRSDVAVARSEASECRTSENPDLTPTELLELLGDEYTRKVLSVIADDPKRGRKVAQEASISRATAYRRLNELQEAGLVETEMAVDPDGHHHERFHAILDRADVSFDRTGFSASVSVEGTDAGRFGTEDTASRARVGQR